jgi:glycosyltransferase involved in cell wall biosynthesis
MESLPNYSVIITSKDRRAVLTETIDALLRQSHPAETIVAVGDKPSDIDGLHTACQTLVFAGSLTAKRNAGMDKVSASSSLLLFVDDDVELHRDYALLACELFASHREIVAASGNVLVDAWIPRAQATAILAQARIPEWHFKCRGFGSLRLQHDYTSGSGTAGAFRRSFAPLLLWGGL